MKSLVTYIQESYSKTTLSSLEVTFNVLPEELVLQVPDSYSESNVQIYMSDRFIEQLPASNKKYEKLFGNNINSITDVFFEYDKYDVIKDDGNCNVEWDPKYDSNVNNEELQYVKITGLRYRISFEKFELQKDSDDSTEEIIDKIFEAMDSNTYNKYPIEIKYNKDLTEIEYEQ